MTDRNEDFQMASNNIVKASDEAMQAPMSLGISPDRDPMQSDDISLAELWRVLYRRRWIIAGVVSACIALAVAYCVIVKPRYTATARIAVDPNQSDSLNLQDMGINVTGSGDTQTRLETEVLILQSDTLALDVIGKLRLADNPLFYPGAQKNPADPRTRSALLDVWRSALTVKSVPKSNLIEVSFRSKSAKLSSAAVNGLIDAYIERNFRVKYESTMQASDWLSHQLDDIKNKTKESEQKLADYQKSSGILVWGEKGTDNIVTESMQELIRALTAAQADRIVKEARYRVALSGDPQALADIVPGSPLQVLRTQQAELTNQYAQATAKFGTAYPRVRQLRSQIDETDAAIRNEIKNVTRRIKDDYDAAKKSESMLVSEMDKQKADAFKMNEGAIQLQILAREAESNRELYEGLSRKLKEAGVVAGLKSTNINVVDYAAEPAAPSDPKVPLVLGLGMGGGLLLGIICAFVLENLDDTVSSTDDAERYSGLPSLAAIPMVTARHKKSRFSRAATPDSLPEIDKIALSQPRSQAAEAFRALRTSILLSRSDRAPKTLVVTSSFPGEGKSTVSLNTAIVLAQENARVLLIDADMRRSSLHRKLDITPQAGLSGVLTGRIPLADAIVPVEQLPNLSLLPAGTLPPYPAELLRSQAMKDVLTAVKEQYDFVIIDTPPVLSVTDAVVLASECDGTLLVMRSGETGRHALRRARNLLLRVNAKVTGIAVNAVDMNSLEHHYYYYGRSKYGSKYGYYYDTPNSEN
jgi:polysaccharide biosynthesis transport protein